jgi:hypothetical protein
MGPHLTLLEAAWSFVRLSGGPGEEQTEEDLHFVPMREGYAGDLGAGLRLPAATCSNPRRHKPSDAPMGRGLVLRVDQRRFRGRTRSFRYLATISSGFWVRFFVARSL